MRKCFCGCERRGRILTTLMVMNFNKIQSLGVLCVGLALVGAGCSSSSQFTTSGNPLLDLRNPELLERDRVSAARQAWEEVEAGVRVRERTRQALKNLAWSNSTTPELRLTVLELLMSDTSDEGSADSRTMARLILPNERSPEAVRVIASRAVEAGWSDLVPALVRSYARVSPNVPDEDRDERKAIEALSSYDRIEQVVFDVFMNPSRGLSDEREQAVLRLSQRTREDAWGLLARLDSGGAFRRGVIGASEGSRVVEGEASSVIVVADLRAASRELGVMPDTAMELEWLGSLRHHLDPHNQRLNSAWWSQTAQVVSRLDRDQREGLAMRHLEAIRWASVNRPAWLSLDRGSLFGVASERMNARAHHKRKNVKGEPLRKERLGDWVDELSWADLLTIMVVDDAIANQVIVDQIFEQRALDKKDTSTEYGGILEEDSDTGFRAVLFRPRSRDRLSDQMFVASDDMFRFSDRGLVHYHMHVDTRNNGQYAGPSAADLVNASMSGRTNLVFTSLGDDELNIDLYQPNGVVIDLGSLVRRK